MAEEWAEIVLAICFGCIAYAYAAYPLLVLVLSRFVRQPCPLERDEGALPRVSLLIAAYNEEAVIRARVENALALDYPADKLDVVVASDASHDGTDELVRAYSSRGVRLVQFTERQGKANALNCTIPTLSGDIVLLSDANTFYDAQAARRMARWFDDPTVGSVCGRLVLVDAETGTNVDSLYWRYETFLKKCESRLGGLLGANGAVYAIRKSVYRAIPSGTLIDDFVIPLYAKLHTKCRLVYDSDAIAVEETPIRVRDEFRRRSRIGAGGYQSLFTLRRILLPRYGWTAFTFLSHKVMRWLCPFFLIGLLVSNLFLLHLVVYQWVFAIQMGFYLSAVVFAYAPVRFRILKPLRLTTMFASMNLALLVGFFQIMFQRRGGTWVRTARLAEANSTAP